MSKPPFCHVKTELDEHISEYIRNKNPKYSQWSPDLVAAKIQFYNQAHPDAMLDLDNGTIKEIADKLVEYEEQQRKDRYNRQHVSRTNVYQDIIKAYVTLKSNIPLNERKEDINFLAYYFSRKLDMITERFNVTREMAANGFSKNGQTKFGEFALFEQIREDIQIQINRLSNLENPTEQDTNLLKSYNRMLDNWDGLVLAAKSRLAITEKLKLGNFLSFAKAMDAVTETETDVVEASEEMVKDPADRIKDDQIASFKKISQITRSLLSKLPRFEKYQDEKGEWHYQRNEKGEPIIKRSRYGIPETLNTAAMHNYMGELLRGVKSKHDVLRRILNVTLNAKEDSRVWELMPLARVVLVPEVYYTEGRANLTAKQMERYKKADEILQCLFLDYNKVFQPYSKLVNKLKKQGKRTIRTVQNIVINEAPNYVKSLFNQKMALHDATALSLYDKEGYLREDQLKSFIKDLEFFKGEDGKFTIKGKNRAIVNKKLYDIALRLNIPYADRGTISRILSKGNNTQTLLRNMQYVYNNTIDYYTRLQSKEHGNPTGSIREANGRILYETLYDYSSDNFTSYMQRLADLFSKYVNQYNVEVKSSLENKVRTKNAKGDSVTLFSTINPGYLSQFMKDVKSYADNEDLAGLRHFLDETFGHNQAYIDPVAAEREVKQIAEGREVIQTNKFRLRWLNDLYNSKDINDIWSFIQQIGVIRTLGNSETNKPFEDFSRREHLQSVFSSYYQLKRNSNGAAKLANYPVFISGDANQFKTITAPIYRNADIIEGLVQLFYQERELQAQLKTVQEDMEKKGQTPVKYNLNEFCLFPAFNEIFAGKDLSRLSTEEVREAIKEYFTTDGKAFQDFKQTCIKYGMVIQNENHYRISDSIFDVVNDHGNPLSDKKLDDELLNFMLNQKYAMAQQMAIMTVTPAFYKNLKDLQKRYKETHSSGQKLDTDAMWNGERVFNEKATQTTLYIKELTLNGENIDPLFMDVITKLYGKDSETYKKYTSIDSTDGQAYRTIESYRKVAIGTHQWTQENEDFYNDLMAIRKNHTDNNGVIHFEDITDAELKTLSKHNIILQPIKPFLFTHENYTLDNQGNQSDIAVQIKSSEAVLIPELMPKEGKLRHLAEYMSNHSVDVAVMTSAIKVGSWGEANISEASTKEELEEALSKGAIHELSYKDYIIQVNVPPHEYQQRLFATQIRKLILGGEYDSEIDYFDGNLPKLYRGNSGEVYTPSKIGKLELKNFYNELIVSNFIDSLKSYLGDIESKDQIANLLIKSMVSGDRATFDSMIAVIVDEKTKDFTIPLCEGIQEYEVVNNLIALFKQAVNKQTILGGSGVQAASYGLRGYEESENLHYVTNVEYKKDSEGNYLRDSQTGQFIPETNSDGSLKYPKDKEGNEQPNILYAEVEIPLIHKYKDANGKERSIDYDKYCNPDGTLKYADDQYENWNGRDVLKFGAVPLIDQDFPGLRDFIAYRIPTERDYSMINCKAVRFTRPTAGITIRVPSQGVTIAGFDFDIDKLYFMFKAFEQDKEGKFIDYDYNKTPYENPKFTRDNMIINIIRHRLMDPHTLRERTTPGGFPNASATAKLMMQLEYNKEAFKGKTNLTREDVEYARAEWARENKGKEDPEPEYDYTDLETLLILNERNQLAAKLIGIFANQNTNHVYCSGLSQLNLTEPIKFGQYAEEGLLDLLHAPEGIDTYRTLAELLAASVDAVKDPVLGYMNLTTLTANAACLLARLGYDFFDIGLLLNQPVIKYVCNYANDNEVSLDYAINEFLSNVSQSKDIDGIEAGNPNQSELIYNIVNKTDKNVQEDSQIAILKLFQNIISAANELNLVVTKTKYTAANAVKPTFGNYYSSKADLDKFHDLKHLVIRTTGLQEAPIVDTYELDMNNPEMYLGQLANNPMAFEQGMYDCMKKAMEGLLEYFPYDSSLYNSCRELFAAFSSTGNLDEKTIDLIHRELPVFIMSTRENSIFNRNTVDIEGVPYGQQVLRDFPQDLERILQKYPELLETDLFKSLTISKADGKYSISMDFSTSIDDKIDKEAIIESWEALLKSPHKEVRNIAQRLFLYNFYKTGFGYGPSSFIQYAPTRLRKQFGMSNDANIDMTYVDFWNDLLTGNIQLSEEEIFNFLKMFIANHLENSKFVTKVYGQTAEALEGMFTNGSVGNKSFKDTDELIEVSDESVDTQLLNNIAKPVYENNILLGYKFSPCLSFYDKTTHERVYFLLQNINNEAQMTGQYRRVYPVGETNKSLQYADDLYTLTPIGEEEEVIINEDGTANPTSNDGYENTDTDYKAAEEVKDKNEVFNQVIDDLATLMVMRKAKGAMYEDSQLDEMKRDALALINNVVTEENLTEALAEIFEGMSDTSKKEQALIQKILEEASKNDLIVLNENGELEKSCK